MSGKKNYKILKKISNFNTFGIDTNIFIYLLDGNSSFHNQTVQFFNFVDQKRKKILTSNITLAEILSFKAGTAQLRALRDSLFDIPNLEIIELTNSIAIEAARIRREHKLSLPDSIQLATAIIHKADLFITNDQKLNSFKEIPIVLLTKNTIFK